MSKRRLSRTNGVAQNIVLGGPLSPLSMINIVRRGSKNRHREILAAIKQAAQPTPQSSGTQARAHKVTLRRAQAVGFSTSDEYLAHVLNLPRSERRAYQRHAQRLVRHPENRETLPKLSPLPTFPPASPVYGGGARTWQNTQAHAPVTWCVPAK